MRTHFLSVLLILLSPSAWAQTAAPLATPARPIPAIENVVIIGVDGLRPDRALLADMPTLRSMLRNGVYTFWAKTTAVSVTLPSFTSMLTGVTPHKHGIDWNRELPFSKPVYSKRPTLLEMAHKVGYSTALIAGKSKFSALNKPGTVDHVWIAPAVAQTETTDQDGNLKTEDDPKAKKFTNREVATIAAKIIEEKKPAVTFIHFPEVDQTGHSKGWGSREQLAAIEQTDLALAEIFAALDRAGLRGSTLVILSADHGGAGKTHGSDDARSRHIPWIAVGPGVRKGVDLTSSATLEVRTEDTGATACYVLGLPLPTYFDGKPVYEAFEQAP